MSRRSPSLPCGAMRHNGFRGNLVRCGTPARRVDRADPGRPVPVCVNCERGIDRGSPWPTSLHKLSADDVAVHAAREVLES